MEEQQNKPQNDYGNSCGQELFRGRRTAQLIPCRKFKFQFQTSSRVDVRGFDFESVKREILIESGAGTGFVKECVKDCDNFIRRRPRTIS